MSYQAIKDLVGYALRTGLIEEYDRPWAVNELLKAMGMDAWEEPAETHERPLEDILKELLDDAAARGRIEDDTTNRDLFDTELMGRLTPRPSQVISEFRRRYQADPKDATDWFYRFSQDTDYIRRYRIARDVKWKAATPYGELDITINLSKPEKDPKAIAAAKAAPQTCYPKCQLCRENEGYAGRLNHPARQNHRIIPITINQEDWFLQYSPYVYYNEHCIVLNGHHTPMKIDKATFRKLLDFVKQFPHYFVGVEAGIVKWPMSVIRLRCGDDQRLVELADRILTAWRSYTDEAAFVFAETDGEPHNTITPIARMRDGKFELDLVLRNNITTAEYPLGVYHPHQELHHIKKENIGLIEVMGLAVLPARLKAELNGVARALARGEDLRADETLAKHADWTEELKARYTFTEENAEEILRREVGVVFATVLEHAGVYKCTPEGREAFLRFVQSV